MARWQWDLAAAAEIRDRFRGWTDCNTRGAMDELAGFLHPDFVYVSIFGRRYDRAGYIDLASQVTADTRYEILDVRARVCADVAEVDGDYHVVAFLESGEDLSAYTRFTASWVREGDEWLALTHHGTRYEPAGQ
ncbi:MAG: nuclear transport factor 2 family protein [Solirubrobacterales bacterium]